jgi:crotonobetainyl-CoA:carnitine CoA-transferase CaiB-like acyl-CoA transferase
LPLSMNGARLPLRQGPPSLGEHGDELLRELGYHDADIQALREAKVIA